MDEQIVSDAYRLFLGRLPRPEAAGRFTDFSGLIGTLMGSPEFRQSPRSRKNVEIGWPENQYFIARNHRILYCPIGKNACTFLKRAMVKLTDHPQQTVIRQSVHLLTDRVKTGLQLSDYGAGQITDFLGDPDLFSFALLRDPERRLLSAYVEKFVKNRTENANLTYHTSPVVNAVQAAQGSEAPDYQRGISFRDFVEHVVTQPPERLDPHWRPQYLYLGAYDWTRLYRFEDIDRLLDDLQARSGTPLGEPPANRSGSGIGTAMAGADRLLPCDLDEHTMINAESFLADDLREKIRAFFARDYTLIEQLD